MTKYNLSVLQQRHLRLVCKHCNLSFHAMAARPKVALELIRAHLTQSMINTDCRKRGVTVTPKMIRVERMQVSA